MKKLLVITLALVAFPQFAFAQEEGSPIPTIFSPIPTIEATINPTPIETPESTDAPIPTINPTINPTVVATLLPSVSPSTQPSTDPQDPTQSATPVATIKSTSKPTIIPSTSATPNSTVNASSTANPSEPSIGGVANNQNQSSPNPSSTPTQTPNPTRRPLAVTSTRNLIDSAYYSTIEAPISALTGRTLAQGYYNDTGRLEPIITTQLIAFGSILFALGILLRIDFLYLPFIRKSVLVSKTWFPKSNLIKKLSLLRKSSVGSNS